MVRERLLVGGGRGGGERGTRREVDIEYILWPKKDVCSFLSHKARQGEGRGEEEGERRLFYSSQGIMSSSR